LDEDKGTKLGSYYHLDNQYVEKRSFPRGHTPKKEQKRRLRVDRQRRKVEGRGDVATLQTKEGS